MERELKFRAWDTVTNQMLTGFDLFGEMTLLGGIHAWQYEEYPNKTKDSLERLNDLVINQFVNITDKNNKDIYDGDILNWDYSGTTEYNDWMNKPHYIVTFEDGYRLCGKGIDKEKKLYLHAFRFKYCEVMGNIHENPELLLPYVLNP